jgi:hypothetical protein
MPEAVAALERLRAPAAPTDRGGQLAARPHHANREDFAAAPTVLAIAGSAARRGCFCEFLRSSSPT